MKTAEFAQLAKQSGCYFILITREELASIPCSIHEIYELQTVGRTVSFSRRYPEVHYGVVVPSEHIIVEDSNSGYDFFNAVYPALHVCSSRGKDNLTSCVKKLYGALVVADGAALGFIIERLLHELDATKGGLIAEESFEYVLLTSSIFTKYSASLEEAMQDIDAQQYFSWEVFFTDFCKNSQVIPHFIIQNVS